MTINYLAASLAISDFKMAVQIGVFPRGYVEVCATIMEASIKSDVIKIEPRSCGVINPAQVGLI
jgi:hypothetical protein